jgi:hypothetical protein
MFDFLHTGAPVLSLDLQRGDHQDFEPDWSLVPDVEFRHRFTADDFERQLRRALHEDTLQDRRAEMRGRILESDPLAASGGLLNLVDRLVVRSQQDDFTVDFCGAAPAPQAAPVSALIERLGAGSLTHAD